MRRCFLLLVLTLAGCESRERGGCPGDLGAFGRDEALRAQAASLPNPSCELAAGELAVYGKAREEGLARLCSGPVAFARGVDGGAFDLALCEGDAKDIAQRAHETGTLLREHIATRDALLAKANEAETRLAALANDAPERRALEDEAAGLRFDARQRDNDIEALRGVAAVEKWR